MARAWLLPAFRGQSTRRRHRIAVDKERPAVRGSCKSHEMSATRRVLPVAQ